MRTDHRCNLSFGDPTEEYQRIHLGSNVCFDRLTANYDQKKSVNGRLDADVAGDGRHNTDFLSAFRKQTRALVDAG